jgi:predicted DNA-binding WGR domain protein
MLGWHYRSRSESLISFSSAAFYHGQLLTVPDTALPLSESSEYRVGHREEGAAHVDFLLNRPVSFHFLENGVYHDRRNAVEADYIAHLLRELLFRETGLSIGIIAFSEAQQGEIENALTRLGHEDESFRARLEAEFEREENGQFTGLLVKNLENIQGDERDVVILSVCYGRGRNGKMLMSFGPINQSGGEKRLNVAFSRAKQHMALVTSIHHHQITNDYNDGARCLKNYLRYAEGTSVGDQAVVKRVLREMLVRVEGPPVTEAVNGDVVVEQLAAALRARGYQVDLYVGQSSFRCDLAVRRAGERTYCAGILVDTEAYYQQSDILERDVMRPKLLESFGWKVKHVFAKDWYHSSSAVLEATVRFIERETPLEEREKRLDPLQPRADREPQEPAAGSVPPQRMMEPDALAPPVVTFREDSVPLAPPSESAWKRYFELVSGTSNKFWEIAVTGHEHTVRFGKIGSTGQSKTKTFADAAAAGRDARRLVNEKLVKGYVEKGTE